MTTQVVQGQVLVGSVGLWVNQPTGYAYQLLRNGPVFQSGMWGPGVSYTVQSSDVGFVITLNVIATNSSGSGPPAQSMAYLPLDELGLVDGTDTLGLVNVANDLGVLGVLQ